MKKISIVVLLIIGFTSLLSFQDDNPEHVDDDELIASYEKNPPALLHCWVKKLADTRPDGTNMIMKIEYENDGRSMLPEMKIYGQGGDGYTTFHDDGMAPDATSGDRIYGAYIAENISDLLGSIRTMEDKLTEQGSYIQFTGHVGEERFDIPRFDDKEFQSGVEIELPLAMLNAADCNNDLKRENSLFITDLSVVEDPVRTYNFVSRTGNPDGAWTFGTLMKNMANTPYTGVSARNFMKQWVKQWTTDQVINGDLVAARPEVYSFLILPWLKKACSDSTHPNNYTVQNWENIWDTVNEANLLKSAPFRLMAIVNRIDLRGNLSYSSNPAAMGETRFIFTLIAPYTYTSSGNGHDVVAGKPPFNSFGGGDFIDWRGMNVIFEYSNIQQNNCDLVSFADQWLQLSSYSLPADAVDFNDALEAITNTVTAANAAPARPNGSAIGQVRTNERIFFPTDANLIATANWSSAYWELRQFELNRGNHYLQGVPVNNTPPNNYNLLTNLDQNISHSQYDYGAVDQAALTKLVDWTYANKWRVKQGSHEMPAAFLAGAGRITYEEPHYWNFMWYADGPNYNQYMIQPYDMLAKTLRQQVSLNTCQGCHAGENKTVFTQMYPRGFGEPATYWNAYPDTVTGLIDHRFEANEGSSYLPGDATFSRNSFQQDNTPKTATTPVISAFLTGRTYKGNGNFQDDEDRYSSDNASDNSIMNGLFYVNDPSNDTLIVNKNLYPRNWTPNPQTRFGFNDLLRRYNDLCRFINHGCLSGSVTLTILQNITHEWAAE